MARSTRLAFASGALLVMIVAGTVIASPRQRETPPELLAASHDPEEPPTGADLAHAADRLAARGINIGRDRLSALAADYGLGGAVRLVAWANETGRSVENLRAMHDSGMGWGQIAHQLGTHPGLGSIMGNGGGLGRETAPGQQ